MPRRRQQSAVVGITFRRDQLERIAEIQRLWEESFGAWTLIGDLVREAVDQYIGTGCPRLTAEEAAFPGKHRKTVTVVQHATVTDPAALLDALERMDPAEVIA